MDGYDALTVITPCQTTLAIGREAKIRCILPDDRHTCDHESAAGRTWPVFSQARQAAAEGGVGAGNSGDEDAKPMHCAICGWTIEYLDAPSGSWWVHDKHPADDHDAEPRDSDYLIWLATRLDAAQADLSAARAEIAAHTNTITELRAQLERGGTA